MLELTSLILKSEFAHNVCNYISVSKVVRSLASLAGEIT